MKPLAFLVLILGVLFSSFAFAETSLGDVWTIVSSVDKPKLIAFCLAAFAGVVAHIIVAVYFTKTVQIEAGSNIGKFIVSYLFADKLGSSFTMLLSLVGMAGAYLMGAGSEANILTILLAGATAGYTSDSMFNRSSNLVTQIPASVILEAADQIGRAKAN